MRAIDRKLLRDLLTLWTQMLAIALVLACGVVTFVMSLSTMDSLERTQGTYYDRYRFADVFAFVKRAPESLAARVASIPGVGRVQTRVSADVILDVEGLVEPAVGRLVSVPDHGDPVLNALYLRAGRRLTAGRPGEVLLGEAFAEAHGIRPGDRITAILNGKRRRLAIVGIVLSPEYVYQIRPGDFIPDDKRFGVFWMGRAELAAAFDMEGAFNDLSLSLLPRASEADVIEALDRLLARYGGVGAYGRADHLSARYVSEELKQLRGTALVTPIVFLAVAAFLLHVVLSRMVGTQREQIAALKAFGYANREVGWHYLKLVLLAVLAGAALGIAAGGWLGRELTALYTHFFRFPIFTYRLPLRVVGLAFVVATAAGVLGTLGAVRRAVRLPPAEAMRPEPPARYGATWVERLGVGRWLSHAARMVLRQLGRRPLKSLLACVGIALAVGVLVLGNFGQDAVDRIVDHEFNAVQRQDVTVTTVEPVPVRVLQALKHYPGVLHGEPFRSVPVRLRVGHRARRLALTGIRADGRLVRPVGADARPVPVPAEGLLLSAKLGEVLRVGPGDAVRVEVLEGRRPTLLLPVARLVTDYTGLNATMDLDALSRALGEESEVSGLWLDVDPLRSDDLHARLKETPRVAGVGIKLAALRSFHDTMAKTMLTIRAFYVLFACVIAFGVVYNTARISLAERSRELATLRVMGFTRREISAILLGELAVLTVLALPLGLALGHGFVWLALQAVDSETYRFPLYVSPWTQAFAVSVVLVAAFLSSLVVRRKLDHLDLVGVLKSKE